MNRMRTIGEMAIGRVGDYAVRVYLDNEEQHYCVYANAHTGCVKRLKRSLLNKTPSELHNIPDEERFEFAHGDVKIFGPTKIFPKEAGLWV